MKMIRRKKTIAFVVRIIVSVDTQQRFNVCEGRPLSEKPLCNVGWRVWMCDVNGRA